MGLRSAGYPSSLLFVVLSFRVIAGRRASSTALGDGSNPDLFRRIRVHSNFAEYVPLALILLGLAEGGITEIIAAQQEMVAEAPALRG